MENGGFVPWDDFRPRLLCGCSCCMGVRMMPTEYELEERISDMLDKNREDVRKALLSLDVKQMNISIEKAKAVTGK